MIFGFSLCMVTEASAVPLPLRILWASSAPPALDYLTGPELASAYMSKIRKLSSLDETKMAWLLPSC